VISFLVISFLVILIGSGDFDLAFLQYRLAGVRALQSFSQEPAGKQAEPLSINDQNI